MSAPSLSKLWRWTRETFSAPAPSNASAETTAAPLPLDPRGSELAGLLNLQPERISRQPHSPSVYTVEFSTADCRLRLAISADFVRADLVEVEGTLPDFDGLYALLADHRIEMIETAGLASCCAGDRDQRLPSLPLALACGQQPLHGSDERLEFEFDYAAASRHFRYLAADPFNAIPPDAGAVWASPGQVLARRVESETGHPGLDIFGRPILVSQGRSTPIQAGPGVALDADGEHFTAASYGYVFIDADRLCLRSPVGIDADGLRADFLFLPLLNPQTPTQEDLDTICTGLGLKAGIDPQAQETLAGAFGSASPTPVKICLAQGRGPVDGRDAELDFAVDCRPQPGLLLPDGRFDFRETHFGLNVEAAQDLATLREATPGEDGFTVRGEVLPAKPGAPLEIALGANVLSAETQEGLSFSASTAGRVRWQDGVLQVFETLHIAGDVDYACGNIDFRGDVLVEGSVQPGFSVRAQGGLAVRGQIENGADIEVEGDLVVGGGIVGEDTVVSVGGGIQTRYIHSAQVRCAGDLEAGSYIIKATVRCGGAATVHANGGRRSGLVAGGKLVVAGDLAARFIGSPSGTATAVSLGIDPETAEKLANCRRQLAHCRLQRQRYRHLLGLHKMDAQGLKRLLRHAPPQRKRQLQGCLRQWQRLGTDLKLLKEKKKDLATALCDQATQASLSVAGTVYANVRLRLGQHTAHIQAPLHQAQLDSDNWTQSLYLQPAA